MLVALLAMHRMALEANGCGDWTDDPAVVQDCVEWMRGGFKQAEADQ